MRKVILYIAVSLDGYIADSNGSVDWLSGQDEAAEMEDTFTPFFSCVDTIIMGRNTYHQVVTELSPDQWPYESVVTYVLTHHPDMDDTENIRFRNMDAIRLVEELKKQPGRDIWICGGAETACPLIANNQIDIYHIAVIPVLLGNGIRLFSFNGQKVELELIETKQYNGIMELVYQRRNHVLLRRLQNDDIERVMQIWLETNIQAHHYVDESYWKSQYDNVKQMISESEVYVCEKSGLIAGFIGLSDNYIAGLFVASDFQSQGIGKRLLDYVKEVKPELSLQVYQKNRNAIRFYLREGFVVESEAVDENTGECEYLMSMK